MPSSMTRIQLKSPLAHQWCVGGADGGTWPSAAGVLGPFNAS